MEFQHQTVLLKEAAAALDPPEGGVCVDGTAGGGGHTAALLDRVGPGGRVVALDRDPAAFAYLKERLAPGHPNLMVVQANFSEMDAVLSDLGVREVDGVMLDLGVSSFQLDASGRGFSFTRDEDLDMRMDPDEGRPARDLVNRLSEKALADLIYELGEERGSRRAARFIVGARRKKPIETSGELADVVRRALRRPGRPPRIDPATRTFQALRLAVNRELDHLAEFLAQAPRLLKPGGRLAVISFHSLEDRLVKQAMKPGGQGPGPRLEALHKKPIRPSEAEASANPRARSAKMRVGRRVDEE